MRNKVLLQAAGLLLLGTTGACMTAGQHASQLHSTQERRMTVGVVQREIRQGMSAADVAMALGSPNIVTRDGEGNDTWIYDKIATEASYSTDAGDANSAITAGGAPGAKALVLGGIGSGYGKKAGAAATTQRTLTVIIQFGPDSLVKSFSYHSSRF